MKQILKIVENANWKEEYPLSVSTIGLAQQQMPIVRPHGLPVHQIFYCTSGSGELTISDQSYRIDAGSGFFLKANEPNSYYGITKKWELNYMGFEGAICASLLETYKLNRSGAFLLSTENKFLRELKKLYRYLEEHGEQNPKELSKMCYACLLEVFESMDWIDVGKTAVSDEIIEKIITYLQREFYRGITLEELSELTGLSKEYMCSYFKKRMNKTIMQVLCDIRIMNACVLLNRFPDKTIAEISKKCGFESPSYFGSVFRKHQGITPDAYRKWIPADD